MSDNNGYDLSISTEIKRPKINIDGAVFELRVSEDFGIRESAFLQDAGKRIKDLSNKPEMAEEEAEKLAYLLDAVTRKIVIDLPDAVFEKLRDAHKIAIINTFTQAVGLNEGTPQNLPGESSPLDSSDSTEDQTPDAG